MVFDVFTFLVYLNEYRPTHESFPHYSRLAWHEKTMHATPQWQRAAGDGIDCKTSGLVGEHHGDWCIWLMREQVGGTTLTLPQWRHSNTEFMFLAHVRLCGLKWISLVGWAESLLHTQCGFTTVMVESAMLPCSPGRRLCLWYCELAGVSEGGGRGRLGGVLQH